VLLHQRTDAAAQSFGDFARATYELGDVEGGLAGFDSELGRVGDGLVDLGGAQQGLRGDAAPVQADAAQVFAFDHCGFLSELGGADGGHVAAGATAEDHDVERISHAGASMGSR
jgi:hypothetical protein